MIDAMTILKGQILFTAVLSTVIFIMREIEFIGHVIRNMDAKIHAKACVYVALTWALFYIACQL